MFVRLLCQLLLISVVVFKTNQTNTRNHKYTKILIFFEIDNIVFYKHEIELSKNLRQKLLANYVI